MQNRASDKEMREIRDLTISAKHTQSTRDSSTISDNSTTRESTTGTKDGNLTALQVKTDISFDREWEMHPETQLSNNRSVIPTDVQALTVLQDLLSDDFQAKNTHSTQKKERRWERWSIPIDPEDPQSTPASPMGSSKAPFIT